MGSDNIQLAAFSTLGPDEGLAVAYHHGHQYNLQLQLHPVGSLQGFGTQPIQLLLLL